MKLNRLIWTIALGVGLFSCSNEEPEVNGTPDEAPAKETTYVAFTLNLSDTKSRATTNGTDVEQNIASAYVMMTDASGTIERVVSTANPGTGVNADKGYYVFQTSPGNHYFYAVVNPDAAPTANTNITTYFNTGVPLNVAAIADNSGNGYFMMASDSKLTVSAEDNVSEAEALAGMANSFSIQVERTAAKVTMTCESSTLTNATNSAGGTVTAPQYYLKGGATKSYRMATSAAEIDGNQWTYTTTDATGVYVKQTPDEADGYTKASPVYCLENLHPSGNYYQRNATYLTLRTVFVPAQVVDCNSPETNGALTINDNTSKDGESFYVVKSGTLSGNYLLKADLEAYQAAHSGSYPNGVTTISQEYVDGVCWFGPIWVGQASTDLQDAPVARNTWYNLHITGIVLPGDPTEPTVDTAGDTPLAPPTNVAFTLSIKDWSLLERPVELQ